MINNNNNDNSDGSHNSGSLVLEQLDIDTLVTECPNWLSIFADLAKEIEDEECVKDIDKFQSAGQRDIMHDADLCADLIRRCGLSMQQFFSKLQNYHSELAEKLALKYKDLNLDSPNSSDKKRKRVASNPEFESKKRDKSEKSADPEWLTEATQKLRSGIRQESADFTKGQVDVLKSLLDEQKNTLFVIRTGGGKSATYFVSTALLRQKDPKAGPTIVVSPLIALMTDQVKKAASFSLRAETYNSSMAPIQKTRVIKAIQKNEIDILFLSAEMLCSQNFLVQVPQLQPNYSAEVRDSWTHLALIVIDEVHCISEWGHDFRVNYFSGLQTIMKQRWTKKALVLGTSATVPSHAQKDIETVFRDREWKVIRGDLYRENLQIRVIYGGNSLTEKINWITDLIAKDETKNILIFSDSKKNVEKISKSIPGSAFYHAEVDSARRAQIETNFGNGTIKVLVSTIALAMGFDKGDIHYVVHTYTPASAIQYYQEIGRAGRGIASATAYLLHSKPWRSDAKRDFALRRMFYLMESCINVPQQIQAVINDVADLNVPEKDANEAIELGVAKEYFLKDGMGNITLPNKISHERMREHREFTQTRLQELQFMKDLMAMTDVHCVWVKLLHFLGQPTPVTFKCGTCTRCSPETKDIRMVPVPENWKMQTSLGVPIYGLSHNNPDSNVDFDTIRELLLEQETELARDPPAWAMTYIPGESDQNKEACKMIAEDLGLQIYEFVKRNPEAGSMRDANTNSVRLGIIENKFFLNEHALPPQAFNILVYDDAAKSGMTMDKFVSFLRKNNPERRVVGLVNTIYTCDGKAPEKIERNPN